jgi:urease beta subunit
MIGIVFAIPIIFADSAIAQNQNQNMTPSMVINMSDLSIKVGNTTSNETITFSNNTNNTSGETDNSTS